ncbi:MAG: hypothetical protein JKY53_05360 [Flavobacteriales bacterium]|nr:hypothetical protein [Flavobacteriales bacterium]
MSILTFWDFVLTPLYMLIILGAAYGIQRGNQNKYFEYKYFTVGLFARLMGAVAFCSVYTLYYRGGDTTNYYLGSVALSNLKTVDFTSYWNIMTNDLRYENYVSFNADTGYPPYYMYRDPKTFSVCRYSSLIADLGFKAFIPMSLLTATFSYIGTWKLYRLFNILYKGIERQLAYAILFIPTLLFWGSGIMKDTYVLGATCWISYNFYMVLIARKKVIINALFLVMNLLIIINIKPYIILSLLPGILLWLNSAYLGKISSKFLKTAMVPVLGLIIVVVGYFTMSNLSGMMGTYGNVDQAINQAQVIQQDLLREGQYGSNSYNIGEIDGTIGGMLRLAPIAIFTAIYRPMFFEIGSAMMVISVLENSLLLALSIYLLIKVKWGRMVKIIIGEPILIYSLVFSLLLAFGVGIAGTNFGAMVRYKVPFVPFYFAMLVVIYHLTKTRKNS